MSLRHPFGFALALLLGCALLGAKEKKADDESAGGVPYAGMDADALAQLKGKPLKVYLRSGKELDDLEVLNVRPGQKLGTLKDLIFKSTEGKANRRTLLPGVIDRIAVGGKPYLIAGDGKKDPWRLVDVELREAKVAEELKKTRNHLWAKLTDDERKERVTEQKEFFNPVKASDPNRPIALHETEYYLFYTDMPQREIEPFVADLDKMYLTLGQAFGVPKGENIWWGKAAVIAFSEQNDFVAFEKKFMDYDIANYQSVCHSKYDGDVVIALHRGRNANYFASLLVLETARGYLNRYRSTVYIPRWLNAGIADWVVGSVVRADDSISRRQLDAVELIRRNGAVGTFFEEKNLETWQLGLASSLVDLLLKRDPVRFRRLIEGIKEGQTWQDSLKTAYGFTPEDLARLYGEQIGVPNLGL
jgi:hypothetical protein